MWVDFAARARRVRSFRLRVPPPAHCLPSSEWTGDRHDDQFSFVDDEAPESGCFCRVKLSRPRA